MKNKTVLKRLMSLGLTLALVGGIFVSVQLPTFQAASSNRVTMTQRVKRNGELKDGKEPNLIIKLSDGLTLGSKFYLELENAEWLEDYVAEDFNATEDITNPDYDGIPGADNDSEGRPEFITVNVVNPNAIEVITDGDVRGHEFKITKQNERILEIMYVGGTDINGGDLVLVDKGVTLSVNLRTKVIRGEAIVNIDGNGTNVSSSKETFAYVDSKGVSASVVGEIPVFYEDGNLATIRIEEKYSGAFRANTDIRNGVDSAVIKIRLHDYDFEFSGKHSPTVTGVKDYGSGVTQIGNDKAQIRSVGNNRDEYEIVIPVSELERIENAELADAVAEGRKPKPPLGALEVSGLFVSSVNGKPDNGDIELTFEGPSMETTDLVVAKVASYTLKTTIEPVGKESKTGIIAGKREDYRLKIEETIKDTLADGRELTFTLKDGFMFDAGIRERSKAMDIFERELKLPRTLGLSDVIMEDTRIVGFAVYVSSNVDVIDDYEITFPVIAALDEMNLFDIDELTATEVKDEIEEEDEEGEDEVKFGGGDTKKTTKEDEKKDLESIELIISGRALANEEIEVTVAKVIKPFTVSIKEKLVKTGLKDQKADDIIITETNSGMLSKGNISIMFDNVDGLSFSKVPTVKVTGGDLRLGKGELIRQGRSIVGITFEVVRPSRKTASSIVISDVVITADRTVPEGDTGILMSGLSIMEQGKPVESEKYVKITTLNIDDKDRIDKEQAQKDKEEANKVKEIQTTFTVGSGAYTINGEKHTMDAAPYIKDGRTMIPVRYISEAIGIPDNKILFFNGVVTLLSDDKIIQLKSGSNIMLLNGTQIPMDAIAEISEGRTYVPIAHIASILDIYVHFDEDTKQVSFNNVTDISDGIIKDVAPVKKEDKVEETEVKNNEQRVVSEYRFNPVTGNYDLIEK